MVNDQGNFTLQLGVGCFEICFT